MGVALGVALSGCVRAATCCHDKCNEWRYTCYNGNPIPQSTQQNNLQLSPQPTSSIFVAVQDRNMAEIARHLVADPDAGGRVNHSDETPLHLGCRLGYLDIVRCLIDRGCPGDVITPIGSPLHSLVKAVKCGYTTDLAGLQTVAELVRRRGCHVDAVDQTTRTVLHHAMNASLYTFSKGLLLLGANPNIPDRDYSFTALHIAVWQGGLNCVSLLLEQPGIQLDARDNLNRTPVMLALLGVLDCVQHDPWPNQLYTTKSHTDDPVRKNRYDKMALVEAMIMAGADLNLTDAYGRSTMVIAHGLLALEMLRYGSVMGYNQPDSKTVPIGNSADEMNSPDGTATPEHSPEGADDQTRQSRIQESLFAPMVRLLVMYGARFPEAHQQTSFMESADWMKKLCEDNMGSTPDGRQVVPQTLVSLCRVCIRRHVARQGHLHRLQDLPLPKNLSNYVQIKYV